MPTQNSRSVNNVMSQLIGSSNRITQIALPNQGNGTAVGANSNELTQFKCKIMSMNQIAATCQQSVDEIAAINPSSPFLASDTLNGANYQSSACTLLGLLAPAVPPPPPSNTFTVPPGYTFSSVSTNTIAPGITWIINQGITLYIPAGITLNNYGTIQINPGGTLFNNGVLTNNYQISNSSSTNANFINGGVYSYNGNNYPAASVIFNNYGSVTGAFNIQNGSPILVSKSQFIINNGSPTQIPTYFTITNGGTCNCYGAINNNQNGTFSFTGTQFTTTASIGNISSMTFNSNFSTTSSIQNGSRFTINGNGAVSNLNTITNGSTTQSSTYFTITNGGTCTCNGPINNKQNGTFSFTGTQFTNANGITITNVSTMIFTSNLTNNGTINNTGKITATGSVTGNTANPIAVNS